MPKRSSKRNTVNDVAQTELPAPPSTDEQVHMKNQAAVTLGRLGGLKGGKARAAALTKRRRSEIAKYAAQSRWKKQGS